MDLKSKFDFGQVLEEKVTGFKGAVVGIYHYSTGCIHYGLAPLNLKDGLIQDWQNIDESRLSDTGEVKDVGPLTVGKKKPHKPVSGPVPRGVDR